MGKTYASEESPITPAELDDETLLAIGKLIRACAEIEDMITLFICNLAEINASKAVVMLGTMGLTRRVGVAKYLADMAGPVAAEYYRTTFDDNFWTVFACRNAVAHGVLMGKTNDDRFAFLTAKTVGTDLPSAIQIVESYTAEDIKILSKAAVTAVPKVEKHLKLEALRAERLQRPLAPHRNARRSGKQTQRPKP